jgi:hypothetical protein
MSDFSKMTVAELKAYAQDNDIDLGSAKTKTDIVSAIVGITSSISSPDQTDVTVIKSQKIVTSKRSPVSNTKANEDGVLTVSSADTFKSKEFRKDKETPKDKVAIYSEKNMRWNGIGSVSKGYNIVTKEAADQWLTRKGVREATAQEVASHYGL